jgi:hypothetical protein
LARDAIHHDPGAWQALVPPDADRVVRVAAAAPSETEVTVHPLGMFDVRQHAVPLETVITHVGANPVPEGQRRVYFGVPLANDVPAGVLSEVTDLFSAGNFLDLSDDQKLSRPSFESMPAGARMRSEGESAPFDASKEADLRYETFVCDEDGVPGQHSLAMVDVLMASSKALALAAGSAGRTELRARTRYDSAPDPIALAHPGEVRAAVGMRVPIVDDRGPLDAEMTVRVYGPADVTEIDPRQVIRTHPKADVVNAEVDDLVQVEFDRPDLPWLFTPAGPDAQGRLVPWVTLAVAERRHVECGATRGAVRLARSGATSCNRCAMPGRGRMRR